MCKELYFISSKCYTNFITTEPFKITIFLYNTGCLKLVSIACLGLFSLIIIYLGYGQIRKIYILI